MAEKKQSNIWDVLKNRGFEIAREDPKRFLCNEIIYLRESKLMPVTITSEGGFFAQRLKEGKEMRIGKLHLYALLESAEFKHNIYGNDFTLVQGSLFYSNK